MPDYKKMYLTLFHAVTDTISLLQDAQIKTEEQFISTDEQAILHIYENKNAQEETQNSE